jgi:cytochrome P450
MGLVPLEFAIPFTVLCACLYLISSRFSRWYTRHTLVRKYGCKEPPRVYINLDDINKQATRDHKYLETTTRLFDEHGKTYKAVRSGKIIIRTCNPEVSKAVLSTHFDDFGMQPIRYEEGKGFFGDGMLVTDGPQWKRSRTLIRPTFDIVHVANFDRLDGHVARFMNLLPSDGATIDMFPLLKRMVCIPRIVARY